MADRWIYRLLNEEFGPIVEDQVVGLIRSQILEGTDEIRQEDSEQWQTLNDVEIFRSELDLDESDQFGVAESLDDLSFRFEESPSRNYIDSQSEIRLQRVTEGWREQGGGRDGFGTVGQLRQSVPVEPQLLQPAEVDSNGFEPDLKKSANVTAKRSIPVRTTRQDATPAQPESSTPTQAKKTKRKKSKSQDPEHDPLLEEIIRELAERGKPGAASPAPAVSPVTTASNVPNVSPVLSSSSGFDVSDSTAAMRQSSAAFPSSSPSASTLMSQQSMNQAATMFPNGGSQSKSFSSHYGSVRQPTFRKTSSLQMPEPKTMGIAGGVVAAAVLVAAFSFGWISSPFGSSGGALPGNAGAVVACYLEYKQFGTAVPNGEEWTAFCSGVESKVKPVVETSADSKDNVTEAGRKLVKLASLHPEENLEQLRQIGGELDKLMPGIVGSN